MFIEDNENSNVNIILILHKFLFYIVLFLTFWSHLQIAITDPGSINYSNNLDIIEFYYFIYKDIILCKNQFHLKKRKHKRVYEEEDDDKYNPYSDEDNKNFDLKTSISKELKSKISKQFNIKTSRCFNCQVVRPNDAHHCCECHCCILDRDHHCPWMNNCIGLFNKKYFIIFNIYAFISVIYSCWIFYYYTFYKNYKTVRNDVFKHIIAIIWGLFSFIYGLFVFIMIIEQRDNVIKEFKAFNKDKIIKDKLIRIKMRIIFGEKFSFKWFLPFYEGGKRQLFFFIREKKYQLYQQKLKEKNNGQKEEQSI